MKKLYLLSVLWLLACSAIGQTPAAAKANKKTSAVKADRYYAAYQFAAAAKAYEKVLQAEPANAGVMVKLVQCYVRLGKAARAKYWLDKAIAVPFAEARHYKALAALLAMDTRYAEAGLLYEKAAASNDAESIKWQQAYKNLPAFYEDSLLYQVSKVPFNSAFSDFSPAFYGPGIVFSSSRSNKEKANPLDKNYTGFIDLFYAVGGATAPLAFSAELNSKYHEGPLTFVPSQDTVFFTRSNFQQKSVFSKAGVNNLKIFYAVLDKGKWQQIQALPLNNNEYSVGHPAVANNHTLYFVSDMPGGYGGTDLYKTVRIGGIWQSPVNLGPEINTSGNEMFPFVQENGALYFASNGHPGLGGLDIFYAPQQGAGFGTVKPVGYPINTPGDDFGLIVKGDAGYYSSNYKSAHDDIYTFKVTRQKQVVLLAVDRAGKPLTEVQLEISAPAAPGRKVTLNQSPAALDWTYGEINKLTLSKKGYTTGEVSFAKADFFKYKAHDTIRVVMPKKVVPKGSKPVQVALQDEEGKVLLNGKIELTEVKTGAKKVFVAAEQGFVTVTLAPGKGYKLSGTNPGFTDEVLMLSARQVKEIMPDQEIQLRLKPKELFAVQKVGATIELGIEYDLAKADIRPDAAEILDKLVAFLQKYPDIKVELGAHTDSRGSKVYNQELSQHRAEAAVAYVAFKGIDPNRMRAIGYGENRLKIAMAKTEAQHQANRRTTVRISANANPAPSSGPAGREYLVSSKSARYFVVIGGFSSLELAKRKFRELTPKIPNSKIILPYEGNKLYRVTIADFAGKEEALQTLPQLKKRFGNSIWILSY